MVQVEHFLVYQQVFLDVGNKLIECIYMLWHRSFLDLCFDISKQISCYERWMIQSIFGNVFRRHFEDHFTVWYLFRNTLNTLGSIFRRNVVHLSVVFKCFVFANMAAVQWISEALDRVTIVKLSSFDHGFWLHDAAVGRVDLKSEHVDRFCLLVNAL
jgi:hypothetical protein